MTYGGNFSRSTPLDEALEAEAREDVELEALEAEQLDHEATVALESDEHTVRRHTEFYPLDPDMRGWSIDEVDAALGLKA